MMAQRCRQSVSRIQLFGQVGGLDLQHSAKHSRNLFFARCTIARDRLLDFSRGILRNGNLST